MRRAKLVMLLPLAPLLGLVAPAATAHAAQAAQAATLGSQAATTSDQAADTTFTCYPNTPAAFNIAVSNVVDKQTTTTLKNGTPIPGGFVAQSDPPNYPNVTAGQLVQTFTNETTGKSVTRNVSAPSWFTYDPAPTVPGALATGTYVTTGSNAQLFGPMSEAALQAAGVHEPTLVFESGLLVMRFVVVSTGPYVTSFSLHGKQQNGCALLAG
jgi:hypothetical protein